MCVMLPQQPGNNNPNFQMNPVDPSSRRILDFSVAALALVATSPILIGASAAIYCSMGAPILFRQKRPGLHGVPFHIIKFRTMRAPKPGEDMIQSDGRRLSAVGRFLRATSIDELPTLWNVLQGDMSLVGPRPLLMQYLDRYTPTQARRHEVKPGVTGWAQVNGRNAVSWEEKFELDVWYVDHRSLRLDLEILARTVWKVVARDGIAHAGTATTTEFMGTVAVDA